MGGRTKRFNDKLADVERVLAAGKEDLERLRDAYNGLLEGDTDSCSWLVDGGQDSTSPDTSDRESKDSLDPAVVSREFAIGALSDKQFERLKKHLLIVGIMRSAHNECLRAHIAELKTCLENVNANRAATMPRQPGFAAAYRKAFQTKTDYQDCVFSWLLGEKAPCSKMVT